MVLALQPPPSLRWLLIATDLIGVGILAAAMVVLSDQSGLPAASSEAGHALLRHYNHLSHGLVLSSVGLTIAGLWYGAQRATATDSERPPGPPLLLWERVVHWCRQHPLLLMLFSAYAVAMVQSTTGFYPELQGWLREIQAPPLLGHFQLRDGLINETMRANSFRFSPWLTKTSTSSVG